MEQTCVVLLGESGLVITTAAKSRENAVFKRYVCVQYFVDGAYAEFCGENGKRKWWCEERLLMANSNTTGGLLCVFYLRATGSLQGIEGQASQVKLVVKRHCVLACYGISVFVRQIGHIHRKIILNTSCCVCHQNETRTE
jgi:hypothetical protein